MSSLGTSCHVALWLALACGVAGAQSPEPVITDTADYCAQLQLEVDAAFAHAPAAPAPEIRTLSDDGQVLCRRGEIRGGIVRLRRALMALRRPP